MPPPITDILAVVLQGRSQTFGVGRGCPCPVAGHSLRPSRPSFIRSRLQEGNDAIATIADELGFCGQSNFTLHFRRHTGQTPAAYRKAGGHSGGVADSRSSQSVAGSA